MAATSTIGLHLGDTVAVQGRCRFQRVHEMERNGARSDPLQNHEDLLRRLASHAASPRTGSGRPIRAAIRERAGAIKTRLSTATLPTRVQLLRVGSMFWFRRNRLSES